MTTSVDESVEHGGKQSVLRALGLSPSGYYRRKAASALASTPEDELRKPRPCSISGRRLSETERETVRGLLYGERFIDDTPTEIYATLLDEGIYHCSVRTIYRLLKEDGANQPRGRAKRHTAYS